MTTSAPVREEKPPAAADSPLAIVGIGASAGALRAFEQFLAACPADTGMAFVLVPHLDPVHHRQLGAILQQRTAMPVLDAADQLAVVAGHVYIIPPNRAMTIVNGVLQLAPPSPARAQRLPIDGFLCALAEDQGATAIGIVLCGSGSDGTGGLRAIRDAGGVCLVQEPSAARHDARPSSAAGYATHILATEHMPQTLLELTRSATFGRSARRSPPADEAGELNQILLQLRRDTGNDFSLYKKSIVGRCIEQRMARHGFAALTVYSQFLRSNPDEGQILFRELLVNATRFFRDPQVFSVLKQQILPGLLAEQRPGQVFRVWVAGCASGEEAYSLAILLRELMDERGREFNVKIYATDLDDDAIRQARRGHYPERIARDLSEQRLQRFFCRDGDGYKVSKAIREMVVFAVHNVITAPPFTRLDLLSCRNLMIYLEPAQQERLIAVFHYALKPDGVLLLSTSEAVASAGARAEQGQLFSVLDRPCSLYRASPAAGVPGIPSFWSSPVAAPRRELAGRPSGGGLSQVRFAQEKRELDYAWDSLEAVIRAQKSSNAELESFNVESRSTSDELRFANRELRSLNAETVAENARLCERIEQLTSVQAALGKVADTLRVGILILDAQLNILFYSPAALAIYPLIAADIGRPLANINSNLADDRLLADLLAGVTGERPVRTLDGAGYVARIVARAAAGNAPDGLALTFTEVRP